MRPAHARARLHPRMTLAAGDVALGKTRGSAPHPCLVRAVTRATRARRDGREYGTKRAMWTRD